jgi:ubiquitin conjugation factor E4 B
MSAATKIPSHDGGDSAMSSDSTPAPKRQAISITKAPAAPRPPEPKSESIEEWTDRMLSSIFHITLKPDRKRDSDGSPLLYLSDMGADLQGDDDLQSPLLALDHLDTAIIEAAQQLKDAKPLVWLVGCWSRSSRALSLSKAAPEDPKTNVLTEAKRFCMSYANFAITQPELLDPEWSGSSPLAEYLVGNNRSIEFLDDVVAAWTTEEYARLKGVEPSEVYKRPDKIELQRIFRDLEDSPMKAAVIAAAEQLSKQASSMNMNTSYKVHVEAFRTLLSYNIFIWAIVDSPAFSAAELPAESIEADTILGPFFALSPLKPDVATNYFTGARNEGQGQLQQRQNSLRMTLRAYQEELFYITDRFIKAGDTPREKVLDWFAEIINKNHKRRATVIDPKTVSTDGFMVNVTVMLDRLCEPFMDSTFAKLDRIDAEYFRRSPRINIDDETKINADQKTSDEFYKTPAEGKNNFITEVFFLTVAAHHYGTEAAGSRVGQLQREVKHFEKQLAKFEAERPKFIANPTQLAAFDSHVQRYRASLEKTHAMIFSIQAVLLDELSQGRSMLFMRYVIAWLLRVVRPESNYPKKDIELPLPEEPSIVFRCLPEYILQDIVDNFKFTTRNMPTAILTSQCEELVTICVTFLRSSEYVKNPYLKSGLVSILFHGVWPVPGRQRGILGDLLNSTPFCLQHLLHSLMKFYSDCESTGGHNQFYDKFNIRYEIFQVIRAVWGTPVYRENLNTESRVNVDFFVRFVNLLLNDVTYVLDESFGAFKKIHDLQDVLEDPKNGLDETQKQEKQEQLEDQQHRAKANMQLTNETVSMLKLFTEVLAQAFTMPEVVTRLADMLDYNLESLVGPKQGNLKVREPTQYEFNPRNLLSDIMDVYLNLKDQDSFVLAVARDGRSYKAYNFDHAATIMRKTGFKSPEQLKAWRKLSNKVAATKEAEEQAEEDLGEVPDEFLDPLMYTLMDDPVILPQSRVTLDRSTIRSHLLSDPNDPFNRQPLKIQDVIPDVELKQKIDAFKAEAKQRRFNAIQASQATEEEKNDVPAADEDSNEASIVDKMDLSS